MAVHIDSLSAITLTGNVSRSKPVKKKGSCIFQDTEHQADYHRLGKFRSIRVWSRDFQGTGKIVVNIFLRNLLHETPVVYTSGRYCTIIEVGPSSIMLLKLPTSVSRDSCRYPLNISRFFLRVSHEGYSWIRSWSKYDAIDRQEKIGADQTLRRSRWVWRSSFAG